MLSGLSFIFLKSGITWWNYTRHAWPQWQISL